MSDLGDDDGIEYQPLDNDENEQQQTDDNDDEQPQIEDYGNHQEPVEYEVVEEDGNDSNEQRPTVELFVKV